MPQHCTYCNMTWSDATVTAHSTQKGYTEEVIEVCPNCHSSLDLHPIVSNSIFSMSLDGVITNNETGDVYRSPNTPPIRISWKPHKKPVSAWADKMYKAFSYGN